MTSLNFAHLRMHTEFSITDSIIRIKEAVKKSVEYQQPALGLTDLHNLFGGLKFYKACRGSKIKPVLGAELVIIDNQSTFNILAYCQNQEGYVNLCELLTLGYQQQDDFDQKIVITKENLIQFKDGLIILSGGYYGELGHVKHKSEAIHIAKWWKQQFGSNFYLEIQRVQGIPETYQHTELMVQVALQLEIPLVATHPIQFIKQDDFLFHEARVCIAEGTLVEDKNRPRRFVADQYFLSTEEMQNRFSDLPSALENTIEIAKRCNVTIQMGTYYLPDYPVPKEFNNINEYLEHFARERLALRLEKLYPDETIRQENQERYYKQLDFELFTINEMGFPGYFLIVADFINWAKNNKVPVGPGRGSGAGSLVAYAIGITDLDPLAYDLLFERFLNPERVSMPDFDIDFCMEGRDSVIDYVRRTYGENSVSQIATFGTMGAKAVIRDVGRVFDMPFGLVDELAKMIPPTPGISLQEVHDENEALRNKIESDSQVKKLFEFAFKLEGLTRNTGMHAGGVIIAPSKLTNFCPMFRAKDKDNGDDEETLSDTPAVAKMVSQFDKDDVEAVGLVKFDFLGLKTLTIIKWALEHIKKLYNIDIDINHIPLDDKPTFDLLKQANTTAVFQLESDGMKKLIKKLQPDCFEDIVALVALYRPGPLNSGMVDDFITRKHSGGNITYMHENLKDVLKPTYGVIVYQEQVMQIAQVLAGYSLGGADMLRRAMGKKKPEEMAKQRGTFLEGAKKNQIDEQNATEIFDLMEMFAEYGFNKSHSAAYAFVSYQTAYLKHHYPTAFMSATMTSDIANQEKLAFYVEDCIHTNHLKFLSPDINLSRYDFYPFDQQHIRYALGGVKGSGEKAISPILEARSKEGEFTSFLDFCCRVRGVSRRVLESQIKAGSFDSLNPNRRELLEQLPIASNYAEQQYEQSLSQNSLFGGGDEDSSNSLEINLPTAEPWDKLTELKYEKSVMGLILTGSLYQAYATIYKKATDKLLSQCKAISTLTSPIDSVMISGTINIVTNRIIGSNKVMFAEITDGTGSIEVRFENKVLEDIREFLKVDEFLFIQGKIQEDRFTGGVRFKTEHAYTLEQAIQHYARGLHIKIDQPLQEQHANLLIDIISQYPQSHRFPLSIDYQTEVAKSKISIANNKSPSLNLELFQKLDTSKYFSDYQVLYTNN